MMIVPSRQDLARESAEGKMPGGWQKRAQIQSPKYAIVRSFDRACQAPAMLPERASLHEEIAYVHQSMAVSELLFRSLIYSIKRGHAFHFPKAYR
jgi:hypothetical protein